MTKFHSAIPKYKRIEIAIRHAALEHEKTLAAIDEILSRKRTDKEIELLRTVRYKNAEIYKQIIDLLGLLYDGVEGKSSRTKSE